LCKSFVQAHRRLGYELIEEHFDDEGYSGATLERPALQRLLSLVRSDAVDRVVVHRLDRLSRNLRHYVSLGQELRHHEVALTVVAAPELGAAALDNLLLNMMASFAEFEQDMTAARIAEARAYLKAKGRRIAGGVPFGYATDARTKQLVLVPEEAEIVTRMFELASAKVTPSRIANLADVFGWRTKNNNRWTARQILFTLSNYVYAGLVLDGFGFREGCHQGLVDKSVYHEVQNILAARRTRTPGRRNGRMPWPLRGLVVCGSCGRVLSTHTIRQSTVIYRYYRCRSTAGGREPCKGVLISAHEIETAVLNAAGLEAGLNSKEDEVALRNAIRRVVFQPGVGRIKIEFRNPDGVPEPCR
jgi:DNA invertase Pin-like site-specific DNA recombinase